MPLMPLMPLVGREAELGRLSGWVSELAAGQGRAVLVEGEPGIGKTALLDVCAGRAAEAGCAVFRGVGDELTQAFPLSPLLQAFDIRPSSADPRRAEVLRALRGPVGAAVGAESVAAAVEALLDLVDQLCAESPALLVVDDLHWSDSATAAVCQRLARSAAQRPLLLVAAMRPLPRRDDLKALRREIGRDGLLPLPPLPPGAVSDLVAELAGGVPGPGLARLAADAAGNPLYLVELVGAVSRGGALAVDGGAAEVTRGRVPATLGEAIRDRLDFLPGPVRELLWAGALLGGAFSVEDLTVVTGRHPAELAPPLGDARAAGVLVDDGALLAFRHPLIRRALYDEVTPADRAAWHRGAARALREAGAAPDRVARQLLPAVRQAVAPVGDWVVDWLVEAAPEMLAQTTPVAVELLEAATRQAPSSDVPSDTHGVRLAQWLAEGLLRLGRTEDAVRLIERTLPAADDPDLFTALHVTLSRCRTAAGSDATGLAELAQAATRDGLRRRHRGLLRGRAAQMHVHLLQLEAGEQAAREALSMAANGADPEVACPALLALGAARAAVGDERGALELASRARATAQGRPDLFDLGLVAQLNVGVQLVALDRVAEAEATLRRAEALADRIGSVLRQGHALTWLTWLFFETGRWDDALTEMADASEGMEPYLRCQIEGVAALIALHRGDPPEFRRHLADAVRLAVALGDSAVAAELTACAEALPAQDQVSHRAATALHCRGLLDADPDTLVRAADCYTQAARPLPAAQAREAAAGLLAEAGDPAAARGPFSAAMDGYAGLGAEWDLARMREVFGRHGLRPAARRRKRPATGWLALTAAEARVAELVAQGRSNPEVAAELVVSRRTVENHVAKVLVKLQARSRVDIVRAAVARAQPGGD
jgi:DNA-binding CsgD family transcriptional regulator/tetratricopeptide (TPR) repeat protein